MTQVFADTSFFVALVNPDDVAHRQAAKFARAFRGEVLTTEWVPAELGNFLSSPAVRGLFAQILHRISSNPRWTIVHGDHDQFDRGAALHVDRHDKGWSMTDCISFVIMKDRDLNQALTTDHHFEQAGFEVSLKDKIE